MSENRKRQAIMADKNPVSNGVTPKSPAFMAVVKAVRFDNR